MVVLVHGITLIVINSPVIRHVCMYVACMYFVCSFQHKNALTQEPTDVKRIVLIVSIDRIMSNIEIIIECVTVYFK